MDLFENLVKNCLKEILMMYIYTFNDRYVFLLALSILQYKNINYWMQLYEVSCTNIHVHQSAQYVLSYLIKCNGSKKVYYSNRATLIFPSLLIVKAT